MIVIVALVGAIRQNGYGNVRVREALVIGALSPLGVLIGVAVANHVSERALQLSFAALALFMATTAELLLVRRRPAPATAQATYESKKYTGEAQRTARRAGRPIGRTVDSLTPGRRCPRISLPHPRLPVAAERCRRGGLDRAGDSPPSRSTPS